MHVAANSMKVSIYQLMVDPEFYVFNYAENSRTSEFLIINEEMLALAPFVDNRLEPLARGQFTIETTQLDELVSHSPQVRPRENFIFHHAFVCSTLMARCLAQSDAFFSLKEPQIIRRLADLRRSGANGGNTGSSGEWERLFRTHLQLLAKNYARGESVVIKASNVANNLVPDVLNHTRESKILYMYCPLEQFLVSNLKKPDETRNKIPALLRLFARDGNFFGLHPGFRDIDALGFLQMCALLWLISNRNFLQSVLPGQRHRVRSLNVNHFLDSPRESLASVNRFFDHEAGEADLDRMTDKAVLGRHAKDPRKLFDAATRRKENEDVMHQQGASIARAVNWLDKAFGTREIYRELEAISVR